MKCPKCGSENINIQIQQISAKSKKSGVGAAGHLNNVARGMVAVSTLGLSNFVWKKSKGTEKTKFENVKICLCQNCGNSWEIE